MNNHGGTTRASPSRDFLASEAAGGIVLMGVAALATVVANSPLAGAYFGALEAHAGGLSVLHWINDGLMTIFFLLVGLEIKRELVDGELSTWPRRVLPCVAAAGGMAVPALVYVALNAGTSANLRGWAIPSATDIAFALGVLALLGPRAPASLKVFLTALAIIDDLGAVAIIAAFYTDHLAIGWLAAAGGILAILAALNLGGARRLDVYLVAGALLWFFVLKSGVHATLAGVALALAIPMRGGATGEEAPLYRLEHAIQPWVAFLVVPVFGFANAGVSLAGMTLAKLAEPVTLGVAAGLFAGKQTGVFLSTLATVRLGLADRPRGASWARIYGVSLLAGVGFTMSLFIGLLAFPDSAATRDAVKVGVLLGSLASAIAGALVLLAARRDDEASGDEAQGLQ